MQLGVTATYRNSCWGDKELLALDRGKIIWTLIFCGSKAHIKVILTPKLIIFMTVAR